ncbi:hypothetical protein ACVIHH_005300 [Bradyrhizobium sp. USDA 4518]
MVVAKAVRSLPRKRERAGVGALSTSHIVERAPTRIASSMRYDLPARERGAAACGETFSQ